MTLPELLITISVMGLIVSVIAASIVVTVRQSDNTEGRLNVARGEQSVDMYLPNDLASAQWVDQDPDSSPCDNSCPSGIVLNGSNALMLTWTKTVSDGLNPVTVTTNVSYYFNETSEPGVYELRRIECTSVGGAAWTCSVITVLHDVELLTNWGPGDAVPTSIIQVSRPLAPDAVNDEQLAEQDENRKDANRVIVTINGGGDSAGAGGGTNRVSITAGGTTRRTIAADSMANAPTFAEARSRCGGPITLIVDDSGSIGSAMGSVEDGVELFVQTFAGTPTQIQVVRFDRYAGVVGSGGAWSRYFDMAKDEDVDALLAAIDPELTADGGTNWEDAWFRTFYQESGQDFAQIQPKMVVFFTDGQPTYERLRYRTGGIIPDQPLPEPGWPQYTGGYYSNGSDYSQVAFNRTKWIVDQVRASTKRIIGVGVGPAFSSSSTWIESPGLGWHWEYQRGYRQHQKAPTIYEQANYESNIDFERASQFSNNRDYESNIDFEIWSGGWVNATPTQYYATSSSSRRIDGTRSYYDVTPAEYFQYGPGTGWRNIATRTATTVSEALYDAHADSNGSDTTTGRSDGWYITGWSNIGPSDYYANASNPKYRVDGTRTYYAATRAEYVAYAPLSPSNWRVGGWSSVTQSFYDANNTTSDESDGYRTRIGSWVWISTAEYNAANDPSASPADSDGYRDAGKQYVTDDDLATDWEATSGTRTDGGYRRVKSYTEPYDSYDVGVSYSKTNESILANLITGSDGYVKWNGQVPGNAADSDLFILPNFTDFAGALQSVALAECGGTLTLSTKVGNQPAPDPFTYQNRAVLSGTGEDLEVPPTQVQTTRSVPTGTFDFDIPGGGSVFVEVIPYNLSDLTSYTPGGWSCKSGITPITDFELVPVNDVEHPGWNGIKVRVGANQAVSCTMSVAL
jgi:hypothetical protein